MNRNGDGKEEDDEEEEERGFCALVVMMTTHGLRLDHGKGRGRRGAV